MSSRGYYQRNRSTRYTTSRGLRSTNDQYSSTTRRNYTQASFHRQMRSTYSQGSYTGGHRTPERRQADYSRQNYSYGARSTQSYTALTRSTSSYGRGGRPLGGLRRTYTRHSVSTDAGRLRRAARGMQNIAGATGQTIGVGATLAGAANGLISDTKQQRSDVLIRDARRAVMYGTRKSTSHSARGVLRVSRAGYQLVRSTGASAGLFLAGMNAQEALDAAETAKLRVQARQDALLAVDENRTDPALSIDKGKKKLPIPGKDGAEEALEGDGKGGVGRGALRTSRLARGFRVVQVGANGLRHFTSKDVEALVQESEGAVAKKTVKTATKGSVRTVKKVREIRKAKATQKSAGTAKSALLRPSKSKKALTGGKAPRKLAARITNAISSGIQRVAQSIMSKFGAVLAVKGGAVLLVAVAVIAVVSSLSYFLSYFSWLEQEKEKSCVVAIDVPPEASPWVSEVAAGSGLSAPLVAAIMYQESSFNPDAENSVLGGHYGLVQMSPSIWQSYGGPAGFDANGRPNGIRNVKLYLKVAAKYMKARWDRVEKMRKDNPSAQWVQELSMTDSFIVAHNAGEGWLAKYPNIPEETTNFIETVRAVTAMPDEKGKDAIKAACSIPSGIANGNKIIEDAKKLQGIPYLWGGEDPNVGLDCSGFVKVVFAKQGISLPRVADQQARVGKEIYTGPGWNVPWDKLKPGDTVSFGVSHAHYFHIGIYAGGRQMIHAPTTGDYVRFAPIDNSFWQSDYWSVRRY